MRHAISGALYFHELELKLAVEKKVFNRGYGMLLPLWQPILIRKSL
jgi:hypothetical protein